MTFKPQCQHDLERWNDNALFLLMAASNMMEQGGSDDQIREEFERALVQARKDTNEMLDSMAVYDEHHE
jgi:hypothetical protein